MPSQPTLAGKRILIFVGDIYEDLELWYPHLRLKEAGAESVLAGQEAGAVYAGKHTYPAKSDVSFMDVDANDFDGVICPGGFMPDKLRREDKVKELVRQFHEQGKLVAAICHGGWFLASAGICHGTRQTGSPGIKDDMVHAGVSWEDAEVVVDGNIVTSRRPDDLPAFCQAIIDVLEKQ
ncbi:type 1 glutamine amidotransferase domain-containing protein [Bremerella sp. JC817]|uniref:type 1 glutamine amidotransferase domain-containing protein n=1 Tax=Bremerella sp. JC817 TaxID=3231756 RepID=UPI0034582DAD